MVIIKTSEEISKVRESSRIVAEVHSELKKIIQPGITTLQLEKLSEEIIKDNGGVPSFKGYRNYPHSICASLNNEIVHGFPNDKILGGDDLLSVDVGVLKGGYHGDAAFTVPVGEPNIIQLHLIEAAKKCLNNWIGIAREGISTGEIGAVIERTAKEMGVDVVKNYIGHGIGRELHEYPPIYSYGNMSEGVKLKAGMTICIEPMVVAGCADNEVLEDGWTVVTKDRSLSAHAEHTILITTDQPEILTI